MIIVALCIGVVLGATPSLLLWNNTRIRLRSTEQRLASAKRQNRAEMYVAGRTSLPSGAPPARVSVAKPATESEVRFDYGPR